MKNGGKNKSVAFIILVSVYILYYKSVFGQQPFCAHEAAERAPHLGQISGSLPLALMSL